MNEEHAKAYQATDPKELRDQIMDCRVGKNEREWWAMREIDKLETERNAWKKREAELKEDLASAEDTIKLKESLIVLWKSKAERLAAVMRKFMKLARFALPDQFQDCVREIAKEALSEFEGKEK